MKKVSEELRYDGATIQQVHEMLADSAFREQVCEYQGVTRHTVQIKAAGTGMTVVVDQVQAARAIPSFARKFVGDAIHIVQSEDWTSPEKGNLHITIPGKPGEMTGTALLTEDPDGTTETVNLTVKVNIPVVGGKVETLVADMLVKALRAEHKVGVRYLSAAGSPSTPARQLHHNPPLGGVPTPRRRDQGRPRRPSFCACSPRWSGRAGRTDRTRADR